MNIGKIVYGILNATAPVTALVDSRMYPDTVPQDTAFPYVSFQLISTLPADTKDGASPLDEARVQVDAYSTNYDQAQEIAKQIRIALDRRKGLINGENVDRIKFESQTSGDYDPKLGVFWVSQDYVIRLKR